MKKIFYILLVMCGLSLGSCVNEVEDIFDQTAQERLNEVLVECQDLLTQPEHGWLIHYYPARERQFGGATFAAKFDKAGNIQVTADAANFTTKDFGRIITSHYSIKSHSSIVLSFDTYNTYIHYWSDPDIHRNKYDADYEWRYLEGNKDRMVFHGIKTGNRIVFEALEEDIVTTMKKIEPVFNYMYNDNIFDGFKCKDANGKVTEIRKTRGYSRFTAGDVGLPYTFVPGGIRFYEEVQIGDTRLQYLKHDPTVDEAKQLSSDDSKLTFEGFLNDRYVPYDDFLGKYHFSCTSDGANNVDIEVEIVEKERDKSFYLRGMNWRPWSNWGISEGKMEWVLEFDPFDGKIECHCQKLRDLDDGWELFLIPCNDKIWMWWPYEESHIAIYHNNDPANFVLTFDAPQDTNDANCFVFGRYQEGLGNIWGQWMDAFMKIEPLTKIYE